VPATINADSCNCRIAVAAAALLLPPLPPYCCRCCCSAAAAAKLLPSLRHQQATAAKLPVGIVPSQKKESEFFLGVWVFFRLYDSKLQAARKQHWVLAKIFAWQKSRKNTVIYT
jgi:hypothetical protein